jgi:RNA polymerase sigma-70 factor (ECF subfamily)
VSSPQRLEFVKLIDSHGPSIMAMLKRLCRNPHDADDVFQDTVVRVWRNFDKRPALRNPRGWLMTIAYHAFVDHHQRRANHGPLADSADDRLKSPDSQAEHAEQCSRLLAAVDELPPGVRQVVVLHYTGGLTLSQTAQAMDLSPGTVKSRLNAALTKLRSLLE